MTQKNNNWLNYLLVFALMLLPLQNGMAAAKTIASAPAAVKRVCHEMGQQSHSQHADMQKHKGTCCDKDMNCQQQCTDCFHCPSVSVILNNIDKPAIPGFQYLHAENIDLPDYSLTSSQFRPPRA